MNLFLIVALNCIVALGKPLTCEQVISKELYASKDACKEALKGFNSAQKVKGKCVAVKAN